MRKQTIFSRVVLGVTFLTLLLAPGKAGRAADSVKDRLLDLLMQKRLLTKDEATSVRAEVNKESQDHAESMSSPARMHVAPRERPSGIEKRMEDAASMLPLRISGNGQVHWESLPGIITTAHPVPRKWFTAGRARRSLISIAP